MADNHLTAEEQARAAFSVSVSSVAFALVLSRTMVEGLRLVRDGAGKVQFTPYLNPLVRRGLVLIEGSDFPYRARLSRAGELTVKMLELCGMIDRGDHPASLKEAA